MARELTPIAGSQPLTGLAYESGTTAAQLKRIDFPELCWVVDGWIVEGLTLLAGAPKIGKSWLSLALALAVATGKPAFDRLAVTRGDVLFLALEDNLRRLQDRLYQMGLEDWPANLRFLTQWPGLHQGCVAEIESWIQQTPAARLVVVDVLARIRSPGDARDDRYAADYKTLEALQALASRYRIAVLVIHHTRKAEADDPFEQVSGTNALNGAADGTIVVKRDNSNGRCLIYGRGRDLPEFETALATNWDNGTATLLGDLGEVGKTEQRHAILEALKRWGKPATAQEVSDLTGTKCSNTRKTLNRMVEAEELTKTARGKFACPNCPNVPNAGSRGGNWDIATDGTGLEREPTH